MYVIHHDDSAIACTKLFMYPRQLSRWYTYAHDEILINYICSTGGSVWEIDTDVDKFEVFNRFSGELMYDADLKVGREYLDKGYSIRVKGRPEIHFARMR